MDPMVQQYLEKIQRKDDPEYWKSLREDASGQQEAAGDNAMIAAMAKAANAFGSYGGKVPQVSQDIDQTAGAMNQANAQYMGEMDKQRTQQMGQEDLRTKLYERLAEKMQPKPAKYTQAKTGEGVFMIDESNPENKIRVGDLPQSDKTPGGKPLKWDIVSGQSGPNGEPVLYNKETNEFKLGALPEGTKPAGKEHAAGSPQFLAAGFGRRLEQSRSVMDQLEKEGYHAEGGLSAVRRNIPEMLGGNYIRNEKDQRQEQAERNFVNATLRRESGAAIAPSEFASAEKQYFPRAGDSPEVLAQKKANREQVLAAMRAEAGNAWNNVPPVAVVSAKPKTESGTAQAAPSEQAQPQEPDVAAYAQKHGITYQQAAAVKAQRGGK